MAYPVDDYREFTVTLYVPPVPGYPKIVIVSVNAPSTVQQGETFTVTMNWRNDGDAGTAWYRILDLDTNEEVLPRTTWSVAEGESGSKTVSITMPARNLRLRLETGHVES